MAKKSRNYGVKDMLEWKFKDIDIPQEWLDHIGEISDGFRMIIHGKSGHGKTEYVMQICKMFAIHYGKVSLNNVEQGRSKTLQQAAIRNNLKDIAPGKFTLCDPSQRIFETWFKRLSGRNSGRFIVLDSLDYMKLTADQFKLMHEKFKHKNIIIVCWDDPMNPHAKAIRYMCDIKVKVHNFKAKIISRFGGNKTWNIWDGAHNANYDAKVVEQPKLGDGTFKTEYEEETDEQAQQILFPEVEVSKVLDASHEKHKEHVAKIKKQLTPSDKTKKPKIEKPKIRVEEYMDYKILVYENQPIQLNVETAAELFKKHSTVREIHELHEVWGGRWGRTSTFAMLNEEVPS